MPDQPSRPIPAAIVWTLLAALAALGWYGDVREFRDAVPSTLIAGLVAGAAYLWGRVAGIDATIAHRRRAELVTLVAAAAERLAADHARAETRVGPVVTVPIDDDHRLEP